MCRRAHRPDPPCAGFLFSWQQAAATIYSEVSAIANIEPRLNDEITVHECRLIGKDGTQMGIYLTREALRVAETEGLDLVEIAPNAQPPVCRIMDYGKYKYDQEIKAKQARKNQKNVEVKEMKFRPKIDTGDYNTKRKHILRFLAEGNKVKVTIIFRGREMAHPEQGVHILEQLADDLSEYASIDQQPKLEGRNMTMVISPLPGAAKKLKEAKAAERAEASKQETPANDVDDAEIINEEDVEDDE